MEEPQRHQSLPLREGSKRLCDRVCREARWRFGLSLMSPRESLVRLLIGGSPERLAAANHTNKVDGWRPVIQLAADWGVIAQFQARIDSLGMSVDDSGMHNLAV